MPACWPAPLWPFIAMTFVVFFYCLGALYDERKDRSVLFWKSLPLSDRDTVLSKVASATLVAPIIASIAALATMFAFLLVVSMVVVVARRQSRPAALGTGAARWRSRPSSSPRFPVYALWSLPTVGWLLLCSAWARSKPFLWALMIPAFAGIFVSWFDLMKVFNLESTWFWKNVVARLLLGTVARQLVQRRTLRPYRHQRSAGRQPGDHPAIDVLGAATPNLWLGVAGRCGDDRRRDPPASLARRGLIEPSIDPSDHIQ